MAKFDSKSFNALAFGAYVKRIPNVTRTELAKSRAVGANENAGSLEWKVEEHDDELHLWPGD